jgi:hypothetical protein
MFACLRCLFFLFFLISLSFFLCGPCSQSHTNVDTKNSLYVDNVDLLHAVHAQTCTDNGGRLIDVIS